MKGRTRQLFHLALHNGGGGGIILITKHGRTKLTARKLGRVAPRYRDFISESSVHFHNIVLFTQREYQLL